MARRIRGCLAGRLVEVTTRTIHGRLLLKACPELNNAIRATLGRAQRRHGMKICQFVFMSNHYHLLLVPESTQHLSDFMEFVNSNIARQAGRIHGWSEKFWSRRFLGIPVSDEEVAQVGRVEYLLRHGTKENLVDAPEDWPGVHCVPELEHGEGKLYGVWHERTAELRQTGRTDSGDPRFQTQESIELSPIPAWEHLPRRERSRRVHKLTRKIRREARERRRDGRKCLGREAVLRQNPHDRPKRSKRSPAPIVHAVAKHVRYLMMENWRDFLRSYRLASDRRRAGLSAEFPEDCFPPARPWMPARASPG